MANIVTAQPLVTVLLANGFGWKFEYSATLAAGVTNYVGFITSAYGAIIDDRAFASEGDDTLFTLFRNTTWSGGTPGAMFNRSDRFWADSSRSPVTALSTSVTASPSAANAMGSIKLRSVGIPSVSIASESNSIFLAPSSSYVVSVTNNDAGSALISFSLVIFQDRISSGIIKW